MVLLCTKSLRLAGGVFWMEEEQYTVSLQEARALLSEKAEHFRPADAEATTLSEQLSAGLVRPVSLAAVYGGES